MKLSCEERVTLMVNASSKMVNVSNRNINQWMHLTLQYVVNLMEISECTQMHTHENIERGNRVERKETESQLHRICP